jgi:hypothetical protein
LLINNYPRGNTVNINDEIARMAHEIYVKSGYKHGRDVENWLEAERIIKGRHTAAESKPLNTAGVAQTPLKKKADPKSVKKAASPKKASDGKVSRSKKTE